MQEKIVIVGGGLAGLACARYIHRAGRAFMLLEAEQRLGGRAAAEQVLNRLADR